MHIYLVKKSDFDKLAEAFEVRRLKLLEKAQDDNERELIQQIHRGLNYEVATWIMEQCKEG